MRKHIGYIVLTMALLCGCAQDGSGVHVEENTENSSQAVQFSEAEVRSWLYDKSVVVTEGLEALSGNEAYLKAFGGTDELVGQVLEWSEALQENQVKGMEKYEYNFMLHRGADRKTKRQGLSPARPAFGKA